MSILKQYGTRETPQSEPIPGSGQVQNEAGGYSFAVDDWVRLERFLILGSEGGTYYATERDLTIQNAEVVVRCLKADPERTLRTVVQISDVGRAPKNEPAILALAVAAASGQIKSVIEVLPKVCRIGTHLFGFAEAVQRQRGWGRGLKRAISHWYDSQTVDALAYQVAKYQQRNGWSHRDLLRLAHPKTEDLARNAVYRWVVGKEQAGSEALPPFLRACDEVKHAGIVQVVTAISDHNLPRECVPTEYLDDLDVWDALLDKMPLMAMVRNLAKMTSIGLVAPNSAAAQKVCGRLRDQEYIKKSRLHPLSLLLASSVYSSGHGLKGSLSWTPVSTVNDALEDAFYLAFGNVTPAGKRTLLAMDVSGSMGYSTIAGTSLSAREAAAAMALVTARTESSYQFMAFGTEFVPLNITARSRLSEAIRLTQSLLFGGTDCSYPIIWALERKMPVDTFVVYTDSQTWAGLIHPSQALLKYREKMGIPARLIVVGMTSNGFSIADPRDRGMLDVVGFDTATPEIMNGFSRGDF